MKKIFITSLILGLISFFGIILIPVSKPVNISQKSFEYIIQGQDIQSLNIDSDEKVVEITLTDKALNDEKYKKLFGKEINSIPHFILDITSVEDFNNYYSELTKNLPHSPKLKVDQVTFSYRKFVRPVSSIIFLLISIWVSLIIYFIPTLVAYKKKHLQFTGILLLNLLLGWTIFLWVAALIWSVIKKEK